MQEEIRKQFLVSSLPFKIDKCMDLIYKMFPSIKKKIDDLEKENTSLKEKLSIKQEQINRVNAFWKKRMYERK